jgi:cephalosporin hydroxylase
MTDVSFESSDPRSQTSPTDEEGLPPPVTADLSASLRSYWLARAAQHTSDSYAGVPISKFPEDLRVYEHLLWASRANVVVELGAQWGGSALWFRDRLQTLARYARAGQIRVISIDLSVNTARASLEAADPSYAEAIALIEADVLDPALPDEVARLLPPDPRCLVVEDSAHVYDTTWAALTGFSRFVPVGGYFVVEDGCVDIEEMRLADDWPRGVLPALERWLGTEEGSPFKVRRDLECYGISCHPRGFLQRTAAARA